MAVGTLDVIKMDGLEGQPLTYQIMFEQNAGGTYVASVPQEELLIFLHEEMGVEMNLAEKAARTAESAGRARVSGIMMEENNLHAIMRYLEEAD